MYSIVSLVSSCYLLLLSSDVVKRISKCCTMLPYGNYLLKTCSFTPTSRVGIVIYSGLLSSEDEMNSNIPRADTKNTVGFRLSSLSDSIHPLKLVAADFQVTLLTRDLTWI